MTYTLESIQNVGLHLLQDGIGQLVTYILDTITYSWNDEVGVDMLCRPAERL